MVQPVITEHKSTQSRSERDQHGVDDQHGERACCTRLVNMGVRLGTSTVLENVNLHLHCGELTVIIGPNGAGKTTLLRAIIGEVRHTGQLIFVPSTAHSHPQHLCVGYVPQRMEIDKFAPLTVLDLFSAARAHRPLWLGYQRRLRVEARQALERVGAKELADKRLGRLSCGQLQRVLLALALTPVPELLLLDEPLAGMDHAGTALFYQTVSGLRRIMDLSILLVSHDLKAAVAVADRIVFIDRTITCEGRPFDVLRHPTVRETFGLDVSAVIPSGDDPLLASARCPARPGDTP